MNKFPEFQGPSPEWETFVKATPLPSGPLNPDAAALREATNSIRIQASNAEIEAEGQSCLQPGTTTREFGRKNPSR